MTISLTALEEELVCELRTRLALSLDDIVEVMRRCMNPNSPAALSIDACGVTA